MPNRGCYPRGRALAASTALLVRIANTDAENSADDEGTEPMLDVIKQESPPRIRCEFPGGPHSGEGYGVDLDFCPNPVCTCTSLYVDLYREPIDEGSSSPEFRFELDIKEEGLAASSDQGSESDRDMGQAFLDGLSEDDWGLLARLFVGYKQRITEETPDSDLKTRFSIQRVEQDGLMVGLREILPFHGSLTLDLKDRHFVLDEQYCVNPGCRCTETMVTLVDEDRPAPADTEPDLPTLRIDYRTRRWEVANAGGEDPTLLSRAAMLLLGDQLRDQLEHHHGRLRNLYRLYKRAHRKSGNRPGRNDPCPCGSGKKYKRCCLSKARPD